MTRVAVPLPGALSQNLLARSREFGNAFWSKTNCSITTGQEDPFGGTLGCKIVENAATATHSIGVIFSAIPQASVCFSIYVKAAERVSCVPDVFGRSPTVLAPPALIGAAVDLSLGIVFTPTASFIQPGTKWLIGNTGLGAGWWRIAIWGSDARGSQRQVDLSLSSAPNVQTYTGDGTSGLLVYGAQVSYSDGPIPYVDTTGTAVNTANVGAVRRLALSSRAPATARIAATGRTPA